MFLRIQVNQAFNIIKSFGVSSIVGPPGLRNHFLHFRKPQQIIPDTVGKNLGLLQRYAHGSITLDPKCTFIQMRNKFRSEKFCGKKHENYYSPGNTEAEIFVPHRPVKEFFIIFYQACNQRIVFFNYILVKKTACQCRNKSECKK